eukprot:ANDGO_06399.mRNA.1 hypothetical protein
MAHAPLPIDSWKSVLSSILEFLVLSQEYKNEEEIDDVEFEERFEAPIVPADKRELTSVLCGWKQQLFVTISKETDAVQFVRENIRLKHLVSDLETKLRRASHLVAAACRRNSMNPFKSSGSAAVAVGDGQDTDDMLDFENAVDQHGDLVDSEDGEELEPSRADGTFVDVMKLDPESELNWIRKRLAETENENEQIRHQLFMMQEEIRSSANIQADAKSNLNDQFVRGLHSSGRSRHGPHHRNSLSTTSPRVRSPLDQSTRQHRKQSTMSDIAHISASVQRNREPIVEDELARIDEAEYFEEHFPISSIPLPMLHKNSQVSKNPETNTISEDAGNNEKYDVPVILGDRTCMPTLKKVTITGSTFPSHNRSFLQPAARKSHSMEYTKDSASTSTAEPVNLHSQFQPENVLQTLHTAGPSRKVLITGATYIPALPLDFATTVASSPATMSTPPTQIAAPQSISQFPGRSVTVIMPGSEHGRNAAVYDASKMFGDSQAPTSRNCAASANVVANVSPRVLSQKVVRETIKKKTTGRERSHQSIRNEGRANAALIPWEPPAAGSPYTSRTPRKVSLIFKERPGVSPMLS